MNHILKNKERAGTEAVKDKTPYAFASEEGRRAAEKAMRLLLFQDRTRKELSDKLYRAGFSENARQEAMEYVDQFNYVNDRRYAENYIMFQKGRRSKKELVYRLEEKGVSQEVVNQILEEMDYDGEEPAVMELMQKKMKGRRPDELSFDERNKIFAFFDRKGYDLNCVKNVFSKLDN